MAHTCVATRLMIDLGSAGPVSAWMIVSSVHFLSSSTSAEREAPHPLTLVASDEKKDVMTAVIAGTAAINTYSAATAREGGTRCSGRSRGQG